MALVGDLEKDYVKSLYIVTFDKRYLCEFYELDVSSLSGNILGNWVLYRLQIPQEFDGQTLAIFRASRC